MNRHGTETARVLARWNAEQTAISACRRCTHGTQHEGRICLYGVAVKTEVARAGTGRCGPEANLLHIPGVI